jgi:hypothetical protein
LQKVDDPKAQALFETSTEALQGLINAFDHFDLPSEETWNYSRLWLY